MTRLFHMSVSASPGKHSGEHVAHIKHSLTNPKKTDVVLCLVVRKEVPSNLPIEALHKMGKEDALVVEPMLRKLDEEQGWLA